MKLLDYLIENNINVPDGYDFIVQIPKEGDFYRIFAVNGEVYGGSTFHFNSQGEEVADEDGDWWFHSELFGENNIVEYGIEGCKVLKYIGVRFEDQSISFVTQADIDAAKAEKVQVELQGERVISYNPLSKESIENAIKQLQDVGESLTNRQPKSGDVLIGIDSEEYLVSEFYFDDGSSSLCVTNQKTLCTTLLHDDWSNDLIFKE